MMFFSERKKLAEEYKKWLKETNSKNNEEQILDCPFTVISWLVGEGYLGKTKVADLEAKLAESEKNFIVANNLRKNSDEVLLNYKTEKYGLDKTIQELRKIKLSMPEKEWYYKGFENCERQMSSHIADLTLEVKQLKQQLAETVKDYEELVNKQKQEIREYDKEDMRLRDYAKSLEQQLDEKDKEIDILKKDYEFVTKQYKELMRTGDFIIEQKDQDKISFCVEQLEKVKKLFKGKYRYDVEESDFAVVYEDDVDEIFDNQIKQLKEME